MSLRKKVWGGVYWSAMERFGHQIISFVVQLYLARKLIPEDFGLIAMVVVFLQIGKSLTDAGFTQALIQAETVSDVDYATVFFVNLGIAALMSATLWLSADAIAAFYGQPELVDILHVLCFLFILNAISRVHVAQLTRELKFSRQMRATMPAILVSGVTAIYLAEQGWGVWALVAHMALSSAIIALLILFLSDWKPTFQFSYTSFKRLFGFGSRLSLEVITTQFFQNMYLLVIGKYYSAAALGFYQRADAFKRLSAENISQIIMRVAFPSFSSIQKDTERMKRGFLRSLRLISLLSFPMMAVMAGVAEPLIIVLIGEKWLPAVPYLQLLCVVGALYPVHALNLSLIKAQGLSHLVLNLGILKRSLSLVVLLVTARISIPAIILGQIATSVLSVWINGYYNRKYLQAAYREQFKALYLPAIIALAAFIVAFGASGLWLPHEAISLLLGAVMSGIILVLAMYLIRYEVRSEVELLAERIKPLNQLAKRLYAS